MKKSYILFLCTFSLPMFCFGQSAGSLYLSKQTGEFSRLTGTGSKSTDRYENGTVTMSHTGPISWSIDPSDLSISPNESKSWSGDVQPDVAAGPSPGSSVEATITGDYDVNYSRPAGTGSGGTVTSTYSCGDSCWYHPTGGDHEIVNRVGTIERSLTVYSIEVTLPDTICLKKADSGNSASGDGTATPFPASGGSFEWTVISGPFTLTNDRSQVVSISTNDTLATGKVKVKFTIEGVSYEAEAYVKTCNCTCKPIAFGETFGPIGLRFSTPPVSTTPDGEGFCTYNAVNASFMLRMNNPIQYHQAALSNVKVSYRKNCQTGEFKDVVITWTGDKPLGAVKFINANLKAVNLAVSSAGNLSGSVTLTASLNQDKPMPGKDIMVLKQGVSGDFKFNFSGGNNLNGSFDFMGVKDINIDIRKGQPKTVIAKFENGALDSAGKLTGTFTAVGGAKYQSNAFTVTMNTLSLGLELSMAGGFKVLDGNGGVTISDMTGVQGTAELSLAFLQGNCNATLKVSGTNIKAFTMVLSDFTLSVTFNSNFDMIEFDGSLKAKHSKFDAKIEVSTFNIKNGALEKFEAKGKVKYSKFTFELLNSSYVPVKLTISAKVELNVTAQMKLEVDKFTIDQDGTITVGKIAGDFKKTPVKVSFSATFETNRFKGNFSGDFAKIGLDGKIDIGAMPAYNFGYFSLTAKVNIPLGQSGLKLTQLGGQIGFNYQLPSTPTQGMYLIGLTIGVADIAGFCEVTGNPVIQLGNSTVIMTLNGTIAILKNNTFFSGTMNVNYKLPDQRIWGVVGTTVKIPGNGFILSTNNVSVGFNIGNGRWSASGSGMGGNMFNGAINFSNGSVNMRGLLSNPLALTGRLRGRASASFNESIYISAAGNSISGTIRITMNANISARINQSGLSGSFGVYVTGRGTLVFDTWIWSDTITVSGWSNARVSVSGSSASLSGTMTINLPFSIPYWGSQVSTGISVSI